MASDWIKINLLAERKAILRKVTEKAILLYLKDNYRCWIPKGIYKISTEKYDIVKDEYYNYDPIYYPDGDSPVENHNYDDYRGYWYKTKTEHYLIFKPSMIFRIFKNKKNSDGKYKNYNEKEISAEEFSTVLKDSKSSVVSLDIEKKFFYITKKKLLRIKLYDENLEEYHCYFKEELYYYYYQNKVAYIYEYSNQKIRIYNFNHDFIKNITFEELKSWYSTSETNFENLFRNNIPNTIKFDKNKIAIDNTLQDIKHNPNTSLFDSKTMLYDFQSKAVAKLLEATSGALFMDMGTGKTRVALELIKYRQNKISKVIWVTPATLKFNTLIEIQKHTTLPTNNVYLFDNKTDDANVPDVFFYIVGIESIGMSDRVILTLNKIIDEDTYLIIDESSKIRRYQAKQTKRLLNFARDLKYKLIMTGTPMSEGIVDLYNPFYFLSPNILGYRSFYAFAKKHLKYSNTEHPFITGEYNKEYLMHRIKPYTYQVKKDEVLSLPEKNYIFKYFNMNLEQEEKYDEIKDEILEKIEMFEDNFAESIFKLFSTLQQIVCGYYNYKNKKINFNENPRIDLLRETIQGINKEEKIIVFTKYRFDIDEIIKLLNKDFKEYEYVLYTGNETEEEKSESIFNFKNNSRVKFFVATFGSAAYGLTLTNSRYCIFYNSTFKYIERIQAEDRLHRIGQISTVNYISFFCAASIDMKIQYALEDKQDISTMFKKELERVKDKNLKKSLVKAIINGDITRANSILEKASITLSSAKRMEKMRRKRGMIPREEYLKNSLSKNKPWEELGISRATWYRKHPC